MTRDNLVEREFGGEIEIYGENLPKCHFVHQKSYINPPVIKPGLQRSTASAMAKPKLMKVDEYLLKIFREFK
jgi:hypothetical protein